MKTSKPISTISYNSPTFLEAKLKELVELDVLSFYAFIRHSPEADERKAHYHIYMELGDLTEIKKGCALQHCFDELDPTHPDKPLGVQPFRKTMNFADWYYYAIHFKPYLISKGQSRKYEYSDDDLTISDPDIFSDLKGQIDFAKYFRQAENIKRLKDGDTVLQLVQEGLVNIREVLSYNALANDIVYRNKRSNHEECVDMDTGEVLFDSTDVKLMRVGEPIGDGAHLASEDNSPTIEELMQQFEITQAQSHSKAK